MRLGIRDSKQLSDEKEVLAPKLMRELKYSVWFLNNLKYNYLTRVHRYNMNKLKHAYIIMLFIILPKLMIMINCRCFY